MKSIASCKTWTRAGCALAGAVALLIVGCGGGGNTPAGSIPAINSGQSGAGSGPGSTAAISLKLALSGGEGAAALGLGKPLSVTATVLDATGKPISNALVAFSSDPQLVVMSPAQGQVATDAAGVAVLTLSPTNISRYGGSLLNAVVSSNGAMAQASVAVTVAQPNITLRRVTPETSPALLKAYAYTVVTLDVLNNGALLSTVPTTISLRSNCAAIDRATMPASVTTLAGRAQFTYTDMGCAQSDTIVASVDGATASVNVNLAAASPGATSIQVGAITPATSSIVIQGAGGSGRSETATVSFKVLDKSGLPVSNQLVSFSTISTKTVRLSQASATTDVNGEVVANLVSGTEPTAVRVVATLGNGLSTVSDTITVTTGLPVQTAFSLSAEEFNIEGFNYDDIKTNIILLLADQFGNPVADGTPVVATTDSGAIGTSARGGCTTVNGRCSVPLRSQNPRFYDDASAPQKRAGLATVQVTTLNGTDLPLTGKISVFFSGSFADRITLIGAPAGVSLVGGRLSATSTDCSAVLANLRLSDARGNPLPIKTALTIESVVKMGGSALPSIVPNVGPRYTSGFVTGDQGSQHAIALLPDATVCEANGPKSVTASALLVITTPLGNTTTLPITLNYNAKADTP